MGTVTRRTKEFFSCGGLVLSFFKQIKFIKAILFILEIQMKLEAIYNIPQVKSNKFA